MVEKYIIMEILSEDETVKPHNIAHRTIVKYPTVADAENELETIMKKCKGYLGVLHTYYIQKVYAP